MYMYVQFMYVLMFKRSKTFLFIFYFRFFDTSKQAFGAFLIHFANVFLADISKGGDPCTW